MPDDRRSIDYRDHTSYDPSAQTKATFFRSERLMVGMNCLAPGQHQPLHSHPDQDKFYLVLEGLGDFEIGARHLQAGPGNVIWAPAGEPHAVRNAGDSGLVLLVGIAPAPAA